MFQMKALSETEVLFSPKVEGINFLNPSMYFSLHAFLSVMIHVGKTKTKKQNQN